MKSRNRTSLPGYELPEEHWQMRELDGREVYGLEGCLKELADHHNAVSTSFRGCFPKRPFQETLAAFERDVNSGKSRIAVIESGEEVLGFCKADITGSEGSIDYLIVRKQYRGKGYGESLMDWAMDVFRRGDVSRIEVKVADGNDAARFYEKHGFRVISHILRMRPDETGEKITARFVNRSAEILKGKLTGIYLHGSAAMGCWHPGKSDLDYIVVTSEDLTDDEKRAYMDMVTELDADGPAKGIEMSVVIKEVCNPFVYPTPFILHYSRMHKDRYRRDPEDYIRKMNGTDRDLAAHFTVIRSRGKCLYGLPAGEVFGEVPEEDYLDAILEDVSGAPEEIAGNPMYLILNLARVLGYLKERKVFSKREGGMWGLQNLPDKYHPLLRSALDEYGNGGEARYDAALAGEYAAYMLRQIESMRGQRN